VSGGIFLLRGDDELVAMTAQPYDTEDVLQALLARFPDLLAGDQYGTPAPRRWLLISREAAVPSAEDGAGRWSLDHLFVDQDAVPTLVEVKRSSDTRIRREVVGQMLDYAANAVVYWPIEMIRQAFEHRCERDGLDAELALADVIDPAQDAETYWHQVAANLQAGRIRLVFVADEIPRELRRIVEFLNEQMTADVIAIEVKQYVGEGVKTLVPQVIGETAAAETRKRSAASSGRRWDEPSFFAALEERRGMAEAHVARAIEAWASMQMPRFTWGKGKVDGSFIPVLDHNGQPHYPIAVYTDGRVEIQFLWLVRPPFDDLELRGEFRRRLNEIPGVAIADDAIKGRPRIPLAALTQEAALDTFLRVLDWFCETVRSQPPSLAVDQT
jgi:hypothetical protein